MCTISVCFEIHLISNLCSSLSRLLCVPTCWIIPCLMEGWTFIRFVSHTLPLTAHYVMAQQPSLSLSTTGLIVNTVKTAGPPLKAANTQKLMGWDRACLMNWMLQNIRYRHIITHIYLQLADNSQSAIDCFWCWEWNGFNLKLGVVGKDLCFMWRWRLIITAPLELVEN